MFKFTEFGKKSGSIHKKNIQKAFHQKYLTTKYNIRYVFKKKSGFDQPFAENRQKIILSNFFLQILSQTSYYFIDCTMLVNILPQNIIIRYVFKKPFAENRKK